MSKTCTGCQEAKPFEDFPKNAASPDGRYSRCKVCTKTAREAYRKRLQLLCPTCNRKKSNKTDWTPRES